MRQTRQPESSDFLGVVPRGDTGAPAFASLRGPSPSPARSPRGTKRRKARTLAQKCWRFCLKHTFVIPLAIATAILLLYGINPTPSNQLHKALFVSYPLESDDPLIPEWARNDPEMPVYYGKGKDDFIFVAYYIVVLSFTREFIMQRFLLPFAKRNGLRSQTRISRFMEQAYTAIYFSFFGPFGLYVMSRTPVWYFNTTGMYESFPHRAHEGCFKVYYLLQASYWAQQAIVLLLQLEKPRKDYYELVAHHIITLALIFLSYRFHFTYIGIAVYLTHDVSDLFLATSLSLNYIKSRFLQPFFVVFVCVWAYLRHWLNLKILWSILTEFSTIGPFEMDWEMQQYKCPLSQWIAFGLLAMLQSLNIFWFFLIIRTAYNMAFKNVKRDVRSDDDGKDEESSDENEVPGEGIANTNGNSKKTVGKSSGVDGIQSTHHDNATTRQRS